MVLVVVAGVGVDIGGSGVVEVTRDLGKGKAESFERNIPKLTVNIPENIGQVKFSILKSLIKPNKDYIDADYEVYMSLRGKKKLQGVMTKESYRVLINSPIAKDFNLEVELELGGEVQVITGEMLKALCVIPY